MIIPTRCSLNMVRQFMCISLCALMVVGARGGSKRPAGSVAFEQPTADVEPFSDVTVLNDADFTKYQDCDEILASGSYKEAGAYRIYLNQSEPIVVFCSFESGAASYGILVQKFGTVSFVQNFYNYERGFGNIATGDGWLGLANIKALTDAGYNTLTVTMQDCNLNVRTIVYRHFSLGPASS
ncbi:fibrinogen-like protein 1 [Dreissena polymorpha]|uniref:fibrinogen-like protein 1 n=1 Tax=Dreissena polymorpha TaxID=45954 RepID=UPI002263D07E|nr:fibrinogen-like protein 1 [Dreissena polymorpha]